MKTIIIDKYSGAKGGATPPKAFAPFGKSVIFSYHSVSPAIFLCHSVNSVIVFNTVVTFLV